MMLAVALENIDAASSESKELRSSVHSTVVGKELVVWTLTSRKLQIVTVGLCDEGKRSPKGCHIAWPVLSGCIRFKIINSA